MATLDQPVLKVERRNVIIVGKAGCGKSSLANGILMRKAFEVGDGVGQGTVRHGITEAEITDATGKVRYKTKMVDTVGLFESGKDRSSDSDAIASLREFISRSIPNEHIHLILFVFRKGRYTDEEKKTMDILIKSFSDKISTISALAISHCDGSRLKAREKVIEDFRKNPTTKSVAEFMKRGIFAVSFPSEDDEEDENATAAKEKQKMEDRKKLLDLILTSEGKVPVNDIARNDSFWSICRIL